MAEIKTLKVVEKDVSRGDHIKKDLPQSHPTQIRIRTFVWSGYCVFSVRTQPKPFFFRAEEVKGAFKGYYY